MGGGGRNKLRPSRNAVARERDPPALGRRQDGGCPSQIRSRGSATDAVATSCDPPAPMSFDIMKPSGADA